MKGSVADQTKEFENLVGDITQTVQQISDPVAIGAMLYSIAQEKNSSNLVLREINAKFDSILTQLQTISEKLTVLNETKSKIQTTANISERDEEVLKYVKEKERVCADTIQEKFNYRGRNAASARLSKLFKDGLLEKIYVGRKVYYTAK